MRENPEPHPPPGTGDPDGDAAPVDAAPVDAAPVDAAPVDAAPAGQSEPQTGPLSPDGPEAAAPAPGPPPTAPQFGGRHMWSDPSRDYHPGPLPLEHAGPARAVETGVLSFGRTIDRLQSRIAPIAFGYAVMKKYFDDEGSRLAAVMAYYTFLSLFPLMIGGVAVLNQVLRNDTEQVAEIIATIVPQPYQDQILASYEALPTEGPALAVALVGLLLAGTGGGFALYATLNQVFAVPYRYRYGFGPRYLRIISVVFIMAFAVVFVGLTGGLVGAWFDVPAVNRVAAGILSVAVFGGSLYASAKILCRRPLTARELALGAVLGGIIVTGVVGLGSWLVTSFIASSTPIYGAFATVVGIISVLVLTSNGLVIALEISVVRAWQLWPRGIDIHLLFPADERCYALLSLMDERMPSQRNDVRFDATGHFDPRRPDFHTLDRRQPGVPRTPYDDAGSPNSSTS